MPDANEEKKTAPRKRRDIAKTDVVDDLGRQLPHNFDAEEGVLAAILIDVSKEVINACVAMKIREDYFFKPEHRLIYSSLIALYSEGKSIDEIVLAEYLKKRNVLEQVGGITAINNIAGRIETFTHYRQWLEILREKYFMREIIRVCAQTVDNAYGNRGDIATFIGDVEQKILAISQDRIGDSVKKASEQVPAAMILINKLISSKGELMGVPTGFTGLDNMMRGLHANEMIVIAGRPGTGKTSIALNIAESALFGREPIPTLIFSLEMLGEQLYSRMIASRARIDQHKLSIGRIGPDQLRDLNTTANELKSAPLWIDDTAGISILEMRAKARRLNQQLGGKLGLVIVDYLQLLRGSDPSLPREQEVAEISRGMKAMSKELLAPVVVLAQLNRDSEKDQRNPRPSDLRESGSIEQDADAILLLSRQKKSVTDEEANANPNWLIRVELAKQRNGPTGVVTLLFNRSYTRYENYIDVDEAQI